MTEAQIKETLAELEKRMLCPSRPWVATSGCTDPRCTCTRKGGKR